MGYSTDIDNFNRSIFDNAMTITDEKFDLSLNERHNTYRDLCDDITVETIPLTLEEIELQIDRLKLRWGEFTYLIGQRLKIISDKSLFESKGYSDFKTYVNVALKMSESNAYYYITVFEYFTEEQTRRAGSKLKLLIPILNKIKKEKDIPEDMRDARFKDMRDELFSRICNKTYRESEKIISDMKSKYFVQPDTFTNYQKIIVRKNRIIINEDDRDIQEEIVKIINEYYS